MIQALFEELSALEQVEAIAVGGSRAGKNWDGKSDWDVYLYCTAPIPEQRRWEILNRYCRVVEIGNHFWEYEDNCTLKDGVDIDILYRNLDSFADGIASVVEEFRASNGYTTCMWHNLINSRIVFDRHGRLTAVQRRFTVPYPSMLRENIIKRNMGLLNRSLPAYQTQLRKAVDRGDLVSIGHRTAAFMESYFDVLFALNSQTHPGEKRLMDLAEKNCEILPRDFRANLEKLYEKIYVDSPAAMEYIARIIEELEAVLQ